MIVTERERERGRDIGRGRSRLHAPGARRGIRSRVSRIAPWAKGSRQTTAPPRDPYQCTFKMHSFQSFLVLTTHKILLQRFPYDFLFHSDFVLSLLSLNNQSHFRKKLLPFTATKMYSYSSYLSFFFFLSHISYFPIYELLSLSFPPILITFSRILTLRDLSLQ